MGNEFKDLFGDWDPGDDPRFARDREGEEVAGEPENRVPHSLNEKEVRVVGVYARQSPAGDQTFVMLEDNRNRRVPIYIARFEAISISQFLDNEEFGRPMTYDLALLIIERLGAGIERVIIDDIWQSTYYAKVTVNREGTSFDIDCRPSDAINLALRGRAPIYVAEAVIEASQEEF